MGFLARPENGGLRAREGTQVIQLGSEQEINDKRHNGRKQRRARSGLSTNAASATTDVQNLLGPSGARIRLAAGLARRFLASSSQMGGANLCSISRLRNPRSHQSLLVSACRTVCETSSALISRPLYDCLRKPRQRLPRCLRSLVRVEADMRQDYQRVGLLERLADLRVVSPE